MIRRIFRGGARRVRAASKRLIAALSSSARTSATLRAELSSVRESVRLLRGEMTKQLSFNSHDLHLELRTEMEGLRADIAARHKSVLERIDRFAGASAKREQELLSLGDKAFETASALATIDLRLTNRIADSDRTFNDLSIRLAHLENTLLSRLNEIDNGRFEGQNMLAHLTHETHARLQQLDNASIETRNALTHIDTSVHSRLNDVLNVRFPGVLEQIHATASFQIESRTSPADAAPAPPRPHPVTGDAFETILARAASDFPTVYGLWRERLDAMASAFAQTKHGNAANAADIYSRLFKAFVDRHIRGQVLDIGCGPFGRPYYLSEYPADRISGIEPLPFPANDEIQIIRGISEYLPFADGAFATVISGTSLDHCLSLERSLDEMARVLRPDGVLLLWLGSNPGALRYDPLAPDFSPADQFHLFHFDHEWFEPMLARRFDMLDRIKLDRAGYSHMFYALCHRPSDGEERPDQAMSAQL